MIQEQIKQLEERQLQIQKELAELKAKAKEEKPEFKVGDWVVNKSNPKRYIGKITKIENEDGDIRIYYDGNDYIDDVRHATHSEIANYLIEEARKRYPIRTMFKSIFNDKGMIRTIKPFDERQKDVIFFYWKGGDESGVRVYNGINTADGGCSNPLVYKEGIGWAEVVPSTPSIEINGYKADFKEWGLDFNNGCAKIDKTIFIRLSKLIEEGDYSEGNKSIEKVTIGKGEFTAEQIKTISSHYTK